MPLGAAQRQRALALEAELEGRLATRVEPFESGLALFREDLPRVSELNLLRLDAGAEAVDAATLMEFLDHLQATLPQRSMRVVEDAAADGLRPHFAAAGWVVRRVTLMAQRRPPDRPVDVSGVDEVGLPRLADARAATLRRAHRDLDSAEQMAVIGSTGADGVETRAFAAAFGMDVAAYAVTRQVGEAAKITEVDATDRSSGKGLGRAVVWGAVRALRASGAKLIVVEAGDDDTWGQWTFHRLGFEEIGHLHRFVRPWG
jgi:predicted GNAT family acetyltransferase